MAVPQSEDDGVLREWAPLSGFLREVPHTVRRGLFLEPVTLTCLDAVMGYLAVGTNVGVIYWYNRETHDMQRLRPEKTTHKITSVRVVSSVDFMVAAGDDSGTVTVFRIPKPAPWDCINPAYKQNSTNSVERYTVGGLHSAAITALEWSMNGQKLFSGDATGLVVLIWTGTVQVERYTVGGLHSAAITALEWSMNGQKLFSGDATGLVVLIWTGTVQVERYTVGGLHSATITALEWSMNGQKLFSGDATGLVVFTEIDFHMNLSKACEILNEKYKVVQLSFNQNAQSLVVATEYRSIIAHRQDNGSWRVVQIGQKERRSLCRVGATFFPLPDRPLQRLVYSGRAGWRFWLSDSEGRVSKTLIFKDAIRKPHEHIRLLQPPPVKDTSWEDLGPVLAWRGTYLVSYNSSSLVILDPQNISVVASLCGLSDLHSVSLTQTEIFIIYGTRNIIRLSYIPDLNIVKQEDSGISLLDRKVFPVADTLLDFTSKIKTTATEFVNSRPPTTLVGFVEEDVTTGTDALELELPPVLPLDTEVQELTVQLDERVQILEQIGKQEFDDIIYRKAKGKSQKQNKTVRSPNSVGMESSSDTVSVASARSAESCSSEPNTRPPSRNNDDLQESQPQPRLSLDLVSSSNRLPGEIPPDILPDLRSPDSILKDVQDNEILVAKAFNLENILLNKDKKTKKETAPAMCESQRDEALGYGPPSGSSSAIPSLEAANPSVLPDINLSTMKPSLEVCSGCVVDKKEAQDTCSTRSSVDIPPEPNDGWVQVSTPEIAQYLSACEGYVCMSGPSRTIHVGPDWHRLDYRAVDLALSPDGQLVWKLDFGVASALADVHTQGPVAARDVESVALSNSCAWYISQGKVYLQKELSRSRPYCESSPVPCNALVLKVCCWHNMVWVLTTDYWVLQRVGATEQCPQGTHWQQVSLPSQLQVADVALGPYNIGWLVDRSNCVYFSDNFATENCSWWQVLVRSYLFENSSLCQITSSDTSVWITNRISPFVYRNSTSIKGHRWNEVVIKKLTTQQRWRQITAEGVFEEKGSMWLLTSANDLFHLRPNCDSVNVVALPCRAEDVASLTAAPHALWLLTHSGQIHVRQGMGDSCPQGDKWRTLNLEQISDKQVTLRHVSCGCDIIWACDTKGDMYMAVGSPYLIATDTFSPAWVQVDGKPMSDTHFVKVFVGSETHIVWALDNRNNVYVRSGIFHDYQLGTDWVLVPDLQATEITISGSTVWALSTTGSVFCRLGISENNYIGNYWYQVPGSLCHLTASVSEGLWGVSNRTGELVVYSYYELPLTESGRQALDVSTDRDDDWEVI